MSWNPFKDKKKTSVGTSVSRVMEDKMLPNSIKTGLLNGLFTGDQLVENILEEVSSSIGVRAERMHQFGKREYLFGLPSSHFLTTTSGSASVGAVLAMIEGKPVTIDYSQYGVLNNLHYGWMCLVQDYGYVQATNELTVLSTAKGYPVYLEDLQVMVTNATVEELENGSLEQWGRGAKSGYSPTRPLQNSTTERVPTPYGVDASASSDYFRLSYSWKVEATIHREDTSFLMCPVVLDEAYFQVKYSVDGVTHWWRYLDGAGEWTGLDGLYTPQHNDLGSFFPFGYFRFNKQSTARYPGSAEYKASEKLMKYLGMTFADVAEAVNENPDIDDVESALLMMAVPADSSDPLERRYLFDFFKGVYTNTLGYVPPASVGISTLRQDKKNPYLCLVIQDKRFKMSVRMDGIYRAVGMDSTTKVGTYSSGFSTRSFTETYIDYSDPTDKDGTKRTRTIPFPCHYYRHQISDHAYEEIQVYALSTAYFLLGGYATSSLDNDNNLLIPLDRDITQNYQAFDREVLYARSLHYVFNSKVVTKVKWYQQGWFADLLKIIAVVITIFSWGTAGPAMAATIAAATVSISALLITVFIAVLKYLVVKLVFKLFVKMVGAEFAMALAVLAAIYGMYGTMGASGVNNAPWASELLQASTGLSSAIQSSYSDALLGIKDETEAFNLYAKEQADLLDKANKLLEGNTLLNPFVIFGETPTDYYNRTVHSGNIGLIGIEAVSSYVDIALTLPKLSNTLGEDFNGAVSIS